MIDLKTEDGIAVVTLAHGKASALDIELCEALTECFEAAPPESAPSCSPGRAAYFPPASISCG